MDDYSRNRRNYTDVSSKTVLVVAAADTATVTLATAKTGWTIFVQRIMVTILTDAAQTLSFKDSAGTPVVINTTDSSPGAGAQYIWDFGSNGKPLTEAKNLTMVISGAGLAAHYQFEAYMRQTGNEYIAKAGSAAAGTAGQVFA